MSWHRTNFIPGDSIEVAIGLCQNPNFGMVLDEPADDTLWVLVCLRCGLQLRLLPRSMTRVHRIGL
jgi:hypothetical protein